MKEEETVVVKDMVRIMANIAYQGIEVEQYGLNIAEIAQALYNAGYRKLPDRAMLEEAYKQIFEKYIPIDKMDEANFELVDLLTKGNESKGKKLLDNRP